MTEAVRDAGLIIAGETRHRRERVIRVNPSTGRPHVAVTQAAPADVGHAVGAARAAAPAMRELPPGERAGILRRTADRLEAQVEDWSRDMAEEMGKPLLEAAAECRRAVEILRFHSHQVSAPVGELFAASSAPSTLYTLRQPVGTVALITPWNFPAAIPAWKLAPAIAAGNSVVLKLASAGALTGLRLAAAMLDEGLPEDGLNVLLGDDPGVGRALVAHADIDAVSFTGSTQVGREVVVTAASRGARVQAEMGGHAPLVVLEDASLPQAIDAAVVGAFASAGQKCTSTRRAYVAHPLYDEFVEAVVERTAALKPGPASASETTLGPLVDREARDRVHAAIQEAARQGRVRFGGGIFDSADLAAGAYLRPAVITDLAETAPLATLEVFGPALAIWPLTPGDDPVALANHTDYGLAAAIFTNDLSAAEHFVREVRAGLVHVNSQTAGAEVHVPFGGHAVSGYGMREQGSAAYAFFTEDRTVYIDPAR